MATQNSSTAKLSLKEVIMLNIRGYKLWWENSPMVLVTSAVYAITDALIPYVGIYLLALLINEIAGSRNPKILMRLIIISLLSTALLSLLKFLFLRWKNYHHSLLWYKQKNIYSKKLLSLDFCDIDNSHTHDLCSQINQNDNWSGWGLSRLIWYFDSLIQSIATIIGAFTLTLSLFTLKVPSSGGNLVILNHPLVVFCIIGIMIVVTFVSPALSTKADTYWANYSSHAKLGNRLFNFYGFMGYNKERALDIRMYRQDILSDGLLHSDNPFGTSSKIAGLARGRMGFLNALSAASSQIFTGIVYVFVCLKALGHAFGVGSVTQYISSITTLSKGMTSLISTLGGMRNNASFLCTLFEFLDIPNNMYQGSLTIEKRSDKKYEIEFRQVSFKYPNTDTYALKDLSLTFTIGERLAVVGMNGSGKTTFIKLLCRLYDPDEGEILLNGINIRKYNYSEYMSIFSVVFQDFKLLSFELGQNVAANMEYNSAHAKNSLTESGFGDRLNRMPNGLDTYLYKDFSDKGVEVSGGEAQKIALARALYKNASFVILDEPTAALDPIAEYEVYSKMNDIVGDKTAVFISHRLSSCRFCHNIAVFHEGKVVQYGNHDELVTDTSGKYSELWNAQAQYYTT